MRMSFRAHHPNLRSLMSPRIVCLCPGSLGWLEHHPSPLLLLRHSGLYHQILPHYLIALVKLWYWCSHGLQVQIYCTLWKDIEKWHEIAFFLPLAFQSISEQQLADSSRSHQNHPVHCQRSPSEHHLPVHGPSSQQPGPEWSQPHVWSCQNTRYLTQH